MITRAKKKEIVEKLSDKFSKSSLILFTDFKGFDVATFRDLRRRIYERYGTAAHYTVVKNTLLDLALKNAQYDPAEYEMYLKGPTAVLYVEQDEAIDALKIANEFVKERKFENVFKGGFLEGQVFTGEDVATFASLPSKQELYGILVGQIQAPIRGFVYALSGILKQLLYALNAIKDKKSE